MDKICGLICYDQTGDEVHEFASGAVRNAL